jgi:tyrosine-protein kinase Etk/Wzc
MSSEIASEAKINGAGRNVEVSLLDLLLLLARRRRALLIGTAGFTVIAAAVAILIPSRFTATAVVLPPQQQSGAGAALLAQLGGNLGSLGSLVGGSLGLKNPNDLQVALIQSRTVKDALISRFNLQALYRDKRQSEARKDLEDATEINSGLKDGLIRISVTDKNPARAAEMANAYVDEYRKFSAGIAVTEASQRRLFFEQQLVQANANLADAEEALEATQLKTGLVAPSGQARAVIESVAALRGQVAAKEVQIGAMRKFAANQNPDLQLAEEELVGLRGQLAQMGAGTDTPSGEFLMPKGTIPKAALEYARKFRDVKYNETVFGLLETQVELAKIDEAKEGSVIQVVDAAVKPDKKSSPPRLLIVAGGAIVGLLLTAMWILFVETLSATRKDSKARELLEALSPTRPQDTNA